MAKLYQLTDKGFLKIAGPEAVKFLQGYTTCDLTLLEENATGMGAICNLQGRMVTSFQVLRTGNDLILRMQQPLVKSTFDFLQKYIVFSRAKLHDISEDYACYGSLDQPEVTIEDGFTIRLGNRTEIWTTARPEATADIGPWQDAELSAGIAWVTRSTREEHLPQMFNYHNQGGIDFEKGCYLGQEIVARAHYRGELKRRLHRLGSEKERPVGSSLDIGTIVATAPSGLLAVLKNTTDESVTATFDDGEVVEATPC